MKVLFLVVFLFLTSCDNKLSQKTDNNHEFFKCTVRVDFIWDKHLTFNQMNNVLTEFSRQNAKGGDEIFGMTFNNHYSLIHFYVGGMDYECPPTFEKNKYKDVEKVLSKYLKPIQNSPIYIIYKKPLLENEFEGLEIYENKY
jgi:hypothetical protein